MVLLAWFAWRTKPTACRSHRKSKTTAAAGPSRTAVDRSGRGERTVKPPPFLPTWLLSNWEVAPTTMQCLVT